MKLRLTVTAAFFAVVTLFSSATASATDEPLPRPGPLPAASTTGEKPAGSRTAAEVQALMKADGRGICYRAHLRDIGWQTYYYCNGDGWVGGGNGAALEALEITVWGVGGTWYSGHVSDIGWNPNPMELANDGQQFWVGTTGLAKSLEALRFHVGSGTIAASVYDTQGIWYGNVNPYVQVGTTGQATPLASFWARV
ncbi:hypothetical protein [Embleya sp. MST-111070]|uniref:hypothetical protein n=1 Tax=Embleya sp. MST-111070 TaxID=3398231 RepID=UPI003F7379CC